MPDAGLSIDTDLDALAESLDAGAALEKEMTGRLTAVAQAAAVRAPKRTGRLAASFAVEVRRSGVVVQGEVRNTAPYAGYVRRKGSRKTLAEELAYEPVSKATVDAVQAALDALGAE